MDKKKNTIKWMLIAVVLIGAILALALNMGKKEEPINTKEVAVFDAEKARKDILGDQAEGHQRKFILVNEDELDKEEKTYVDIVKNIPGPHQNGDLFVFAVQQGKETISYFEDVTEGHKITIYFKKEKAGEKFKKDEDKYYVVGKVKKSAEYEISFLDVKTMKPLILEKEVVKTKKTAKEEKALKEKEKAKNTEQANKPVINTTSNEETTKDEKREQKKTETKPAEKDTKLPEKVEIIDDRKSKDSFEGVSFEIIDTHDDK